MPLESVDHIDDLDPDNPFTDDSRTEGDDHLRNIKKGILNDINGFDGATLLYGSSTTGTDDYTFSTTKRTVTTYNTGMLVCLTTDTASAGAATLNIDSAGVKNIVDTDGNAATAGQMPAGTHLLQYDGTNFVLLSPDDIAYVSNSNTFTAQQTFDVASGLAITIDTAAAGGTNVGVIRRSSVDKGLIAITATDDFALLNGASTGGITIQQTAAILDLGASDITYGGTSLLAGKVTTDVTTSDTTATNTTFATVLTVSNVSTGRYKVEFFGQVSCNTTNDFKFQTSNTNWTDGHESWTATNVNGSEIFYSGPVTPGTDFDPDCTSSSYAVRMVGNAEVTNATNTLNVQFALRSGTGTGILADNAFLAITKLD